ncbi:MAG: hypothetical protein HC883_03650, partial [Bdellovibrionaceae bacterium]|nr:hypothetical protein [Pseudobdellovibrionaceae bacterium]
VSSEIGGADKPVGGGEKVSFSDVEAIIGQRCARCHSSGPMNWTNKDVAEAAARSGKMAGRVGGRTMPPPNEPEGQKITADERARIVAWAKGVNSGPATTPVAGGNGGSNGGSTPSGPEVLRDKNLAFASRCMACHGGTGVSASDDIPNLASLSPKYIEARLLEFNFVDSKKDSLMSTTLKQLVNEFSIKIPDKEKAPEEFVYAGAFFGNYSLPPRAEEVKAEREKAFEKSPILKAEYEAGKAIVTKPDNQCMTCHNGPDLRPMDSTFPAIFQQKQGFLLARLKAFREGTQGGTMPGVLQPLDLKDADLKAIAVFLSLSHASEAVPPQQ